MKIGEKGAREAIEIKQATSSSYGKYNTNTRQNEAQDDRHEPPQGQPDTQVAHRMPVLRDFYLVNLISFKGFLLL